MNSSSPLYIQYQNTNLAHICIQSLLCTCNTCMYAMVSAVLCKLGARWPSGRVSDSGSRGPWFESQGRRVVSLSKIL